MATGRVTRWNGQIGRIRDDADGAECFFGDRALRGLQPADVSVGMAVDFDRGQNDRGPFARNVRARGTSSTTPPASPVRVSASPRVPVRNAGNPPRAQDPLDGIPVPAHLRGLLATVGQDPRRHPGLMLDRFLRPCPQQEQQREVLAEVACLDGDGVLLAEHHDRRLESLRALGATVWSRTTEGPLTLHLARASALENAGICLHPLYGFVYLPGTGLKGLARAYAETVWLPSQPDPVAAWKQIEAVFGWAPGSDEIDHRPKPWKPEGIPRRGDADKAAAGSVVFHDAWPEKWPRLEVDIVNNHHAEYYQGDHPEPPGDWSSPVPVYFLSVRSGTTFRFALSRRRPEVPAEAVVLAETWLDGGLTRLGCGAKTAAGYGSFQMVEGRDAGPLPASRAETAADLELVTPGFLAGADQKDPNGCDLRPASLRGLLRWWWRTLHAGFLGVEELRALESILWGDTRCGAALRVHLEPLTPPDARLFDYKDPRSDFKRRNGLADRPNNKTTQGLFYAAYGMDEVSRQERRQRFHLEPGCRWRLRLAARDARYTPGKNRPEAVLPAAEVLTQARLALWLLCHLGAVGSKARKGFGSLRWENDDADGWGVRSCLEMAAAFRHERLGLDTPFTPDLAESPALAEVVDHIVEVDTPWANPWQALDRVGFVYQKFAQSHRHDPAKVSLGLPRKIHGPKEREPMPGQQSWQPPEWLDFPRRSAKDSPQNARHASPIHIHLERTPTGTLRVRAVAFPSSCLPDRQASSRFLGAFLEFFDRALRERARVESLRPGTGPAAPPPAHSTGTRRPEGTPVRVKVVGRHERLGPSAYFVEEDGKPRGVLNVGRPPAEPPQVGALLDVFVLSDSKPPQYRWDAPAPQPPQGRRGRRY